MAKSSTILSDSSSIDSSVSISSTTIDCSMASRPPMNQEEFDKHFAYRKPKTSKTKERLKKIAARYTDPFTSWSAFKTTLIGFFPILQWLPAYKKAWIVDDIIGGLTVGVMHVPQGIAYAALAKLPAQSGLYISFLPPLIYLLFGTSRHTSLGSFAVVALMCGDAVSKVVTENNNGTDFSNENLMRQNIEVATCLTLMIGLLNLIMALLRLDFIATYFSEQVVGGFTTGASIHVMVSQLYEAFGLPSSVKKNTGPGAIVMNLFGIAENLMESNVKTCTISLFSIMFLLVGKELISPMLKRRNFRVPIPFELILIIIVTIISYFLKFDTAYHIKVVANISTEIPLPRLQRIDLMTELIPDAFAITIVVFAIHISLAKMCAKKANHEIDPNMELVALGLSSSLSSFFPIYPVACSLGRTMLNVQVGTKTLLSNVFASLLLLSVIVYLAKYFYPLPKAVLSCIVIVALTGIFSNFRDLGRLWTVSKIDLSIWLVSFLSTVFINVIYGLAISIGYALFTTIARVQWSNWRVLGIVHNSMDYKDSERYGDAFFFQGLCVFRFDSPLLFMNVERFRNCVDKALSQWERSDEYRAYSIELDYSHEEKHSQVHFIIDCSGVTSIDFMGVSTLKEVYLDLKTRNVEVYFAASKAPVRELFAKCGFYATVAKENFYPTIRDAVAIARLRQNKNNSDDLASVVSSDVTTVTP